MPLPQELLRLARELVDRNAGAPIEADLRRGVSSAYYAFFHLLVHEAIQRVTATNALQYRLARAFDHRTMKQVCQDYAKVTPNASGQLLLAGQMLPQILVGQVFPQQLKNIASEFVALQEARHQADYDTSAPITQLEAQANVMRAESAFLNWTAVQGDPAADAFLIELFCRGLPKR